MRKKHRKGSGEGERRGRAVRDVRAKSFAAPVVEQGKHHGDVWALGHALARTVNIGSLERLWVWLQAAPGMLQDLKQQGYEVRRRT